MNPCLVYIVSLGHSGSTILQYILAGHANVLGLGEIARLNRGRVLSNSLQRCSCGLPVDSCSIWKDIVTDNNTSELSFYKHLSEKLKVHFPQITHWIDTSKSIKHINPWLQLLKDGVISEIKILYLFRDVRGWALSEKTRRKKRNLPSRSLLMLMFDWKRRQKRMLKQLQKTQPDFLIVSYESIMFQTQSALARIASFVDLQADNKNWLEGLKRSVVHDVYGNRLKDDPVKRSQIIYDDRWQYHLCINLLTPLLFPVWRLNTRLRRSGQP